MHEFSTACLLVESVLEKVKEEGATSVLSIELVVGKLTLLSPEQLIFCFETITEGTMLEGAELKIEETPPTYFCSICGSKGDVRFIDGIPFMRCPDCNSPVDIQGGRECVIRRIKAIS
ncbi:MAG: hydrogenase maturation nickel metallochaperone HypA [Methermicoccaceae archaeon]